MAKDSKSHIPEVKQAVHELETDDSEVAFNIVVSKIAKQKHTEKPVKRKPE